MVEIAEVAESNLVCGFEELKSAARAASHRITELFWEVINTAIAILTELYTMLFYSPLFFLSGRRESYTSFGLNPTELTDKQADSPAVLFLHGQAHNQSGARSLASKLEKAQISPVFTVNLNSDEYKSKLRGRITQIKEMYEAKGKELHLIFVGHSKGGIEASEFTYCDLPKDPMPGVHVDKVITLASRLKVIEARWPRACHPELQPRVNKVNQAIMSDAVQVPLFNVVSGRDWKVPYEAAFIRTDKDHGYVVESRSHLGILYSNEALDKVVEFIKA